MTTDPPAAEGRAQNRTIQVDYLARVEGEGALHLAIDGDQVRDVRLEIFEPPRFFEAFLRGRDWQETVDIVARICGICPVAYQMSAVHALEQIAGIEVTGALRELRRLLYCGEWIESHVLHMTMLHAPDFLGYESAIHLAAEQPGPVESALALKKTGNEIITAVGGREVHPINVRVGGFFKAPETAAIRALREPLLRARDQAVALLRWAGDFDFPDLDQDYRFVALHHDDEYAMNAGRIVAARGAADEGFDLNIAVDEYEAHFAEHQVPHSTALHSLLHGEPYLVGPMARFTLNHGQLSPLAREMAAEVGLQPGCRNPFRSILARGVEVVYACDEALRIVAGYEKPDSAFIAATPRAGSGCAATEAPRGLLWHRYAMAADGTLETARIVPPTAQNQPSIEADLHALVQRNLTLPDEQLQWRCEQAIRNYDPCISCATHFLKLDVQRT